MLSPKAKRNIARIIPFGIIWFLSSMIFLIVEYAATGGNPDNLPDTAISMNFQIFFFMSLAVGGVGLLVGIIELLFLNNVFVKKSLTKKIVYKLLLYSSFLFVIILITYPIAAAMELHTGLRDSRVWDKLLNYLVSVTNLSTSLQLMVALSASLFYYEVSEHMGHRVLLNFLSGKYHIPKEEKRIFMFSDMKSSTTIAEKLGHIKYFELLRDYYSDFSEAIILHSGEVYQYIGDEIIISWKFEVGIENNNCINCYFAMKEALQIRADRYRERYGVVPNFKTGLHFGDVTTGEIGALKKEITFTGDVLNATARIQGLCNQYEVDLLISEDLLQRLNLDPEFKTRSLGQNELRGKVKKMRLHTIMQV